MKFPLKAKHCLWLISGCLLTLPAGAFDFGNMMNPNKWFNGNRDRDDYYGDYYGPPGGYGYPHPYEQAPAYTAPGYGTPGYAAPGYASPGYGTPGYPNPAYAPQSHGSPAYPAPYTTVAPQAPATPSATTNSSSAADSEEIARLKQRVRELEAERANQTTHWQATQPAPDTYIKEREGSYINTWQAPMTRSPAPVNAQPAGGYGIPGESERKASRYIPPPQYPGLTTYDLGR